MVMSDDHRSHESNNKTKDNNNNDLRETIRQKKQTK